MTSSLPSIPADPDYPPKNLGVYICRNLSMDDHIKKVSKSISYALFSIGKIRKYLDQPSCSSLITGLIFSRLDYCNSLLYGVSQKSLNSLQLLQNRAARVLTFTPKYAHISNVLKSLHWLPVSYRIEYKMLFLCFKAQHDLAPGYLKDTSTICTQPETALIRQSPSGHKKVKTSDVWG